MPISRRSILAAGASSVVTAAAGASAQDASALNETVADLVWRSEEANAALVRGDVDRYPIDHDLGRGDDDHAAQRLRDAMTLMANRRKHYCPRTGGRAAPLAGETRRSTAPSRAGTARTLPSISYDGLHR